MPYDLKTMTDRSLKQLDLVMEDFCHKAELKQSTAGLEVDYLGLKGVGKDDHKAIIDGLIRNRYIHTEYHMFYLQKTFYPFLDEVSDELHQRLHHAPLKNLKSKTAKKKGKSTPTLALVTDPGILIIGSDKIDIDPKTNAFKVLEFILVKNKSNISKEFRYAELAKSPMFGDLNFPKNKTSWETYRNACRYVNDKILKETGIQEFLLFGSKNTAKFSINSNVLETLGLNTTKLG
jgi:hypothetical protein